MNEIKATRFEGGEINVHFDVFPSECPFCHKSIKPLTYQAFLKGNILEIVYRCPDPKCGKIFTAKYENKLVKNHWIFVYQSSSLGTFVEKDFSENIKKISQNFIEIYNQANKAESLNLNHISGIGFRKALEFLVKDYLIHKSKENEENIKKKFLGKCIKEDINNINIKEMAERAAWLGNDETHYVKKWLDKDINDLKILINIVLHWIEMELLTEQYKSEMN